MPAHPYEDFLLEVQRPGRYTGGEFGANRGDPDRARVSLALVFPDAYEVGMSHLGWRILYDLVNQRPEFCCDRVFAPWPDLEAALRERDRPLVTLDSRRPLADFDLVGFSLQYELAGTNILTVLDRGGLPRLAAERGPGHPLVLGGGPGAYQPEPLAPFFDLFLLGDGEAALPALMEEFDRARRDFPDRRELLAHLVRRVPGWYAPALYEPGSPPPAGLPGPVARALVPDLAPFPFPAGGPVPGPEMIFDRFSLELARGCPQGCRFCQAGTIYRPLRPRPPRQVYETVLKSLRLWGCDEISLTSLSPSEYPGLGPLLEALSRRLASEQVTLSVSSLKATGLPEASLPCLSRVRPTGLTLAPEAGSERLRRLIGKEFAEETFIEAAARAYAAGWTDLKLYFMLGLPGETEDDLRDIVRLAEKVRLAGRRAGGKPGRLTVSVSSFVPKAHTPFQWCAMDPLPVIREKQALLRGLARKRPFKLRLHRPEISWLEGIFSRGGRELAGAIERAHAAGCRFDSWDDQLNFTAWEESFAAAGLDPADCLAARDPAAPLPWDHLSPGPDRAHLLSQYRETIGAGELPATPAPGGCCSDCGLACDTGAMAARDGNFRAEAAALAEEAERRQRAAARRPGARTQVRYRLAYAKRGLARFLSHLDLVRGLPRVLRRAGLDLDYTEGFHPKPKLVFGPALALGLEGEEEVFDISLRESVSPRDLLPRLNALAPEGLEFRRLVNLTEQDLPATRVVNAGEFLVRASGPVPAVPERLVVERRRRERVKTVDIAPAILGLEGTDDPQLFRLRLLTEGEVRASPLEAALALFPGEPPPRPLARLRLFLARPGRAGEMVGPLEISQLRRLGLIKGAARGGRRPPPRPRR